jgi:hypothetical protein
VKTCPACGFDPETDDPDAYVAQGGRGQLAAEVVRLPSLPSAPECDCKALRWGDRYHQLACAISVWMGRAIEVVS